jgi:hypothetical protein
MSGPDGTFCCSSSGARDDLFAVCRGGPFQVRAFGDRRLGRCRGGQGIWSSRGIGGLEPGDLYVEAEFEALAGVVAGHVRGNRCQDGEAVSGQGGAKGADATN